MFRKLFKRSRRRSRSRSRSYTGVELDFNAIPTFSWSLDFRIGQRTIAETHSPSPFALLAVAEEIALEHGIPGPPAELRLRHMASGDSTRVRPGAEPPDPADTVRRARPDWQPGALDDTATRTTLTNPDGEAVALGDVLAAMRAAGQTASHEPGTS